MLVFIIGNCDYQSFCQESNSSLIRHKLTNKHPTMKLFMTFFLIIIAFLRNNWKDAAIDS